MLTCALAFFSRFQEVHDSGADVIIARFGKDQAVEDIMKTLRAAYSVLYGPEKIVTFHIAGPRADYGLRSIYDPLFPRNHLHVAVCSKGLEWLSKVPEEVVEKGWNKMKVWIEDADPKVVRAYAEQADKDLVDFLKCRKDELKIGGSLFMQLGGRPSGSESQFGDYSSGRKHPFNIYMDRAWQELVDEDSVKVEKRNRFNIPIYFRSQDEVKAAIERCGGFKIEMMVNLTIADHKYADRKKLAEHPVEYGECMARMAHDAIGGFIETYLGAQMTKKLFDRYATIAENEKYYIIKTTSFTETIAVSLTRV